MNVTNSQLNGEFEPIFRNNYASLCHFAWQILKDENLVEDVVQDAFLSFLKCRNKVTDHPLAIKNYLYSSVRNACYNKLRSLNVQSRYHHANPFVESEEPTFVNEMIRTEVMNNILKIITELPEGCQRVFRLSYLEGLSNAEVANELNVSVNTVKTHKLRGLRVLREALSPEAFGILFLLISNKN